MDENNNSELDWTRLMRDPEKGVEIKDRKWMLKTYPKCFVGKDAVTWMVKTGIAKTRADAIRLGKVAVADKVFHHVTKDHNFEDENLYYRFEEDEQKKFHGSSQEDAKTWAQFLPTAEEQKKVDNEDSTVKLQPRISKVELNIEAALEVLDIKPLDKYNIELLDNVHPPKWINPVPQGSQYNIVVIGAGAAGLVTAAGSAGLGAKVALIEKHMLGGDCLNFGCVPSKALIRAAHAVAAVRDAHKYGVKVDNYTVDFGAIMERMRKLRSQISHHDSAARFTQELGIDVFMGEAKFLDKNTIQVGERTLKFTKCCIATGGRPAVPTIPGLKEAGYYTNMNIFNLTELPKKLVVIGGGPIGCELAQAFARFGSEVTILARTRLLPREDPDAAEVVAKEFQKDGVKTIANIEFLKVEVKDGLKNIHYRNNETKAEGVVSATDILVATGRVPNVENLNLEAAGVKYDARRGVTVNDFLATSNGNIYACGDICSDFKFTHMADNLARIVIKNALFYDSAKASNLIVPWATFTYPEVAHVGLYEQDLVAEGIKFQTYKREFKNVDRAILDDEMEGFVKVHVQEGTDKILGATIVAKNAGDMISEVTLAMNASIGLSTIATVIHPYPTQAEAIRQLGDEYNRTRLTPAVKVLFRKLFAARRS